MNKKYELTDETINHWGTTLHRIKALRSFGDVKAGDLGGYIQSEDNLSHEKDCWIYNDAIARDNAKVLDNAKVKIAAQILDDAIVFDNATVSGDGIVCDNSKVYEYAKVFRNAKLTGKCELFGHAAVSDNVSLHTSAKVYGNAIVQGDACVTGANIYDKARVTSGIIVGATINGNTLIDADIYLKDNAYISSISDYTVIIMNGITVAFYLSENKDIYLTFGIYEYKLDDLKYVIGLSDNAAFPMMVELAKKYLLKERNAL